MPARVPDASPSAHIAAATRATAACAIFNVAPVAVAVAAIATATTAAAAGGAVFPWRRVKPRAHRSAVAFWHLAQVHFPHQRPDGAADAHHADHHHEQRRGFHHDAHLPRVDDVFGGRRQRKRDAAPQAAVPHGKLGARGDVVLGFAEVVHQPRAHLDVEVAPYQARQQHKQPKKPVVLHGAAEDAGGREAQERKDEGLADGGQDLEHAEGPPAGARRQVPDGVVGHGDAREQNRHDARKLQPFRHHVRDEGQQGDEAALHFRVPAQADVLKQQRRSDADAGADEERPQKVFSEKQHAAGDGRHSGGLFLKRQQRVVQHNGHGVVQDAFPKHQRVQVAVHLCAATTTTTTTTTTTATTTANVK